jgi:uncharacterized protein YdeI (YjbR/CyaY-like superfamily)
MYKMLNTISDQVTIIQHGLETLEAFKEEFSWVKIRLYTEHQLPKDIKFFASKYPRL